MMIMKKILNNYYLLYHIDRKLNSEADKLANLSLDNFNQEITN